MVLGAVGEERSVRSDRPGDERRGALGRAAGQVRRMSQQGVGLVLRHASTSEPRVGGLVGGRRDDVRAHLDVATVDRFDRIGPIEQDPGRPQRVVEVETVRFQLGGQAAVEDQHLAGVESLLQGGGHGPRSAEANPSCPASRGLSGPTRQMKRSRM